jgi:cardiolipin synthase
VTPRTTAGGRHGQAYRDPESFALEAQGHRFTFHPHGRDRFEALLALLSGAKRSLDLAFYMFEEDETGLAVRDALVAAARRGVAVRLVIDDFGSDASDRFFHPLIEAGGRFERFSARWSVRYLVRNHQKFVIADGERVMTGGFNITSEYFAPPSENGWCDLGVVIEGPVAERFVDWFGLLLGWIRGSGSELREMRRIVKDWDGGEGAVQLLLGGPLVQRANWAYRFRRDLAAARRLDAVSAYFTPTGGFRWAMSRLARSGKVRLITAGVSDFDAAIDVARLLYRKLLQAGVRIYEFQPCKLHMKLLVVDEVSYFGSANLDKRSIRLNVELMVRVEDMALAARLRELIDHLEGASREMTPERYREKADFLTRLRWRLTYLLALADYRVTYQLNSK